MGFSIYGETYRKRGKTFYKGVSGFPYSIENGRLYYDQDCISFRDLSSNLCETVSPSGNRYTGESIDSICDYIESLEIAKRKAIAKELKEGMITLGCFVFVGLLFYIFPIWPFVYQALKFLMFAVIAIVAFMAILALLMNNNFLGILFSVVVLGISGVIVAAVLKPTKEEIHAQSVITEQSTKNLASYLSTNDDVLEFVPNASNDSLAGIFDRLFEEAYAKVLDERPGAIHNPLHRSRYRDDVIEKIWEPRLDRLRIWFRRNDPSRSPPPIDALLKPFPMPWEI